MEATLHAVRRGTFGKNEANRLRAKGHIPAVLYGGAADAAEPIAVDPKSLMRILHSDSGVNTLIALDVEGGAATKVLVKEYQVHPVGRELIHADFYRIAMDKVLQLTVPIKIEGEAKGIKLQGGVLDFVHREIEIECLPADIPDEIVVDVTELMLHQGVRVRDLVTGGKWTPLSEPEMLIIHLVAPKVEAAPTVDETAAAATAAPAEPEVIKKGKVDKEEESKG